MCQTLKQGVHIAHIIFMEWAGPAENDEVRTYIAFEILASMVTYRNCCKLLWAKLGAPVIQPKHMARIFCCCKRNSIDYDSIGIVSWELGNCFLLACGLC